MLELVYVPNLPQKDTVENSKNEHHHQIQHIRIRSSTKFHLKQTTLIFLDQICLERVEKILSTIPR